MTVLLYAIQLFWCIDFVPFSILQCTQETNICEEMKKSQKKCQKEIRIKELCPCVCDFIKEIWSVFCHCVGPSRLSSGDPLITSLMNLLRPLRCYYNSGVVLGWNVSSIIAPRCLSCHLLVLSEDCSPELCSKCRFLIWVPNGPGIGRGCSSSPSSSS